MSLETMKAALAARMAPVTEQAPELGGEVILRPLDSRRGLVVSDMYASLDDGDRHGQLAALRELIALSVVDDCGVAVLDSEDGRKFVAEWPIDLTMRIGGKAAEINGLKEKN